MLSTPRFKIGLILAESFDRKTHKRKRPFDTVKPIANELGLKVDTDCQVDDAKCVRKKIERYARKGGKGDVLICWVRLQDLSLISFKVHKGLTEIVRIPYTAETLNVTCDSS